MTDPTPGPGPGPDDAYSSMADASIHPTTSRGRWRRRMVLTAVGVTVVVYYMVALGSLGRDETGSRSLGSKDPPADRVTVQLLALDVDTATRSFEVRLRPVPRGQLAGQGNQLRQPLQLEIVVPGNPPTGFDFPADQMLDPVTAAVETRSDAYRFPFDRHSTSFALDATSGDRPVPVDVELVDDAAGWDLTGSTGAGPGSGIQVGLDAQRETLTVSFALFYIAGTAVVALIAVTVIAGAVTRKKVSFERVIWLGAMLVVIPAVRNEMPGVPPVGTAVDRLVFLPSVVVVAVALLASIALLTAEELGFRPATADGE